MFTSLLLYLPLIIGIWIPIAIFYWALYRNLYWKRHNVPYVSGTPLIGNLTKILTYRKSTAQHIASIYDKFSDKPIFGIHLFTKPALVIREPELIKRIMVKDFNVFSNRHSNSDYHSDLIGSANLFLIRNPLWRFLRTKLTPIFTSGRIKQMYGLVNSIGTNLNAFMMTWNLNESTSESITIETKDLCSRYTMDVIASCAFGVEANSIQNSDSEFIKNGRSIFKFNFYRAMEFFSFFLAPQFVPIFKFKLFSKESTDFLRSSINYVIKEREQSGKLRNDLIDTLVTLKQNDEMNKTNISKQSELALTGDVLVAQAAVFFTAGFETTSSAMSFTLFELSWNQEYQRRLRQEIKEVLQKTNGKPSYEDVLEMEYLNMVVTETLRLYPALPFLDRLCQPPKYESDDGYSLDPYYEYNIPDGMPVLIPIFSIHRDPAHYPNPLKYDPERFSKENKIKIKPYTYLPFGTGPHNCIGERFGILQIKIGLINVLRNHRINPTPGRTPRTISFEEKSFTIQAKGGIHLDFIRDQLDVY